MGANYLKFLYLICQLIEIIAQWYLDSSKLTSNNLFTALTTTYYYNLDTEYFYIPLTSYTSANFITCTIPSTSYITLNATYLQAQQYDLNSYSGSLYYIYFDLYFQGTWSGESVVYTQGSITYTFSYTSPPNYALTSNFCDNLAYEVKTVNFTSQVITSASYIFKSTNTGTGQVSIRNYLVSRPSCYYTCNECLGSQYNQCQSCYYGTVSNGICPNCPSSAPYYMKNSGCFKACSSGTLRYADGFCQSFLQYSFISGYFNYGALYHEENFRWTILYDQDHVDTSPQIFTYDYFGVFKYGAGIYRYVNEITQYNTQGSVLINLQLIVYGPIPLNCGIQFKINSTYYASIYMNSSGLQLHNVKLYQQTSVSTYQTYTSNTRYEMYFLADIPLYPFGFSIIGNYTTGTSGWALDYFSVTTGVCPKYCQFCEVAFICNICKSGYYLYRDGTCISCSSSSSLQTIINSYCQDIDDLTPYSKYLAKEYLGYAGDPNQYSQYTLLSQSGSNLLKGSTIYFSYWNSYRIFGGPYVWSQAKFVRKFTTLTPHHKITILFNIIFGPKFPSDGSFIYTLENNSPQTVPSSNYTTSYTDGSKMKSIKEIFSHSLSTFNLYLECFGPNNEPLLAFCGMSNLYVVIHECQPYCSVCTDQFTCSQWNSTFNAAIIKFSQSDCQSTEYFSKEKLRCFPCPIQCETCVSELSCLTCQPTFQKTILGCKCKQQQYELNNQCYDCPIECNQCLRDNYCIECLSSNYRKLVNNQCVCLDGYYSQPNNPVCQFCNTFCKTCNGPTFNNCLTCQPITNIQLVQNTCQCPTKTYFDEISYSCLSCHSSCLNCYSQTINSCLSCDSSLNRILKGLQCKCKPGYYELNNVCTNCPVTEDITLQDCYRFCSSSNIVWHTTICNSCEQGFQLIQAECQPICGDLVIAGYEQCEDGNDVLNDKCYNCQFQCPFHCLTCNIDTIFPCPDVCGDGYITGVEECEDGNTIPYDGCYECKYSCQQECTNCVKGQCQECATQGWHIDPTVTPWQCKETCGDGIIVGTEQCEDGNNDDTDGCKNCRYFCRIGCTDCDYTTNTCFACQYAGFKPQSYYCKNICGDGLKVTDPYGYYSEECDDGNTISYDGCSSSCYFQCQSSTICTTCSILNKCTACSTGLVLNTALNKCITICGDGILSALEQCEDSLTLPYKCQKCKTFCQQSCKTCGTTGLGCSTCADGYKKIDGLCYPICGDKKVTVEEDCDDGNLIFDDGCHNCQFVCQYSCIDCYQEKCLNCMDGFELINFKCFPICGDGINNSLEQCEQINSNDNCKQCQYVCPENCFSCLHGICLQCNDNYELNFINGSKRCDLITQVQQVVEYCEFQVNEYCNKCAENAYYDIFDNVCKPITQQYDLCEILLETNCQQCIEFCEECNSVHCIKCEQGYYLNQQFQCKTLCGDGLVLREEQCDDALQENEILQCFQCQIVCPDYCKVCTLGYCLECETGYYLDFVSNTCQSQCGDMIVATNEVCDDGNEYRYDGCFKCQYQCQQQCLNCQFGKCYECEKPLKLIESEFICEEKKICLESEGLYYNDEINECFAVCGDGIKADKEDCDDANETPNDGCFKCKYQCIINCTNCQQGQCFECETGYELVGQYCKTICGDGLILENEQCDDGNQISRDGCSSCKIDPGYKCVDEEKGSFCYKCQDNCTECEKNKQNIQCLKCQKGYFLQDNTCNKCSEKCEECEKTPNNCLTCSTANCETCKKSSGLYMDLIQKKCVTQCGDGIKAGEEACDDGNIIDKDGCNSVCQIEKEFNCDSNGCNLLEKKKIEFIYTNSTSTTEFNLLYDDVESDLCQNIKINIEQFQQHEFYFTVNKKTNQSEGTQMCDVKFNFFKTIMEHNLIHVKIPLISNKRILIEEEREIVIVPRKVVFYDAAQQAQAESVASASSTFTFLLQLIGPLTILLGGFNFFWTILDILTWINNFYFMNVDYPLNVKIFFSKLNWGDIISIPDIIVLNQPNDEYYFEAPTKFTEKDVNPLFMINIQVFISLVVLSVIAYLCSILILKIIVSKYQKQLKPRYFEYFQVNQNQTIVVEESPPSPQKQLKMPYLIEKIYYEAKFFQQNFGSIFIQVINLAFLDICLACTLQLVYAKNQNFTIIQVNIILAFIGIIFIFIVFQLYTYVSLQHEILYENKKFQTLYQSLYEGINTKSQWARKYCFINLFRKALFIFCTVYFYEMPLLQTSTCCLTCFLNLAFIVFENPFQNRSLLIQTSLPDFCIFIIIFLTVILSVHDSSQILTFDEKMTIGWLILCLIGVSILIQVIFLLQQLFSQLKERFNQIKQLICQNKQQDIKKE